MRELIPFVLSHPVSGILLQQPQEMQTLGEFLKKIPFKPNMVEAQDLNLPRPPPPALREDHLRGASKQVWMRGTCRGKHGSLKNLLP